MSATRYVTILSTLLLLWSANVAAASPGNTHDTSGLLSKAEVTLQALASSDFPALAEQLEADGELALSPYSRNLTELGVATHRRDAVARFADDATRYHWGYYDGIGSPILLTARDYFKSFVYDIDYATVAERSVLLPQERIDADFMAVYEAYPSAVIVRYHFPGTDVTGFKDFRDLLLVFTLSLADGQWYLVALAHGESTL